MAQLSRSAYVRNLVHIACSQDQLRRGAQGRFDPFAQPFGDCPEFARTTVRNEFDLHLGFERCNRLQPIGCKSARTILWL
jgi:hypothetical protein